MGAESEAPQGHGHVAGVQAPLVASLRSGAGRAASLNPNPQLRGSYSLTTVLLHGGGKFHSKENKSIEV